MSSSIVNSARIRAAWQGRISGCLLGKPLEVLSFQEGRDGLERYLQQVGALPLRDYVPMIAGTVFELTGAACCRENIARAEPDDDINYTVLALLLMENHGIDLDTADVARAWLRHLPGGTTWTAEREAYRILMNNMDSEFVNGAEAGFDIAECSDNAYNDWIGAQIRADLYGWVCPGRPALAAGLASKDASLSHRGDGVYGAAFVAALGAAIPISEDLDAAFDEALNHIPADGKAAAAIGNAVAAGWDTDCNGATVGGLFGLTGAAIPNSWTQPWAGRVGVDLAGLSELPLDDLVDRTIAVANKIALQVDA